MIKVYLSGPITSSDHKLGYKKAFEEAEKELSQPYFEIVSPLKHGEKGDKKDPDLWKEYMKKDLDLVWSCDAIALMPGWDCSPGCLIELTAALKKGLRVITLDCENDWDTTTVGKMLLTFKGFADRELVCSEYYRKLQIERERFQS